ncbi:MAG: hypothetical protein ACRD20_02315 [Terriglobales bacterium]
MPTATAKPKSRSHPLRDLTPLIHQRQEAVRRGHYEMIGTVSLIHTVHGTMRFPHESGPSIGFVVDPDRPHLPRLKLLALTPWTGLPALRESSENPCTDCLRDCDVCAQDGKKTCQGVGCGGAGKLTDPSTGEKTSKDCEMCGGSGRMTCPNCRGTRKVPTGLKGGVTDFRQPKCDTCRGTRFLGKESPQDLEGFVNARLGGMIILGPIERLVVDAIPGTGKGSIVFDIEPDLDKGDLMVVLLEPTSTVTRIYFLGGVLKEKSRR